MDLEASAEERDSEPEERLELKEDWRMLARKEYVQVRRTLRWERCRGYGMGEETYDYRPLEGTSLTAVAVE